MKSYFPGFSEQAASPHQALQFNLTQCHGDQHSMSRDVSSDPAAGLHPFLTSSSPSVYTLLLPEHPRWLMFLFPHPWTCQLHLQRQHLLGKSVLLHLCCENVTVTQLKMSQELGYLDRFEKHFCLCVGICPMPLFVNGYDLFQKKRPARN